MDSIITGRIYKITNDFNDKIYIGSTLSSIEQRFINHKRARNDITKQNNILYIDMRKYGIKYFEIILLEEVEVENRRELCKYEAKYIKQYDTINKGYNSTLPYETEENKKERRKIYSEKYREENDKKLKESKKDYYEENKEYLLEKQKKYWNKNKKEVYEKNKIYWNKNKKEISEKTKIKIDCDCGSRFRKSDKKRHERTKKHIKYMK